MPIPYRDQDELEELGTAAFLLIEAQAAPPGYRGALFQIDARGEPVEFTYNRLETPSTFLWRPADVQRAAARRLTVSLLDMAPRVPRLILCRASETPAALFVEDLAVAIPVCRIATGAEIAVTGSTGAETIEGPERLHLFWQPAPPGADTPGRALVERLTFYGLLLEPFARASAALDELYGAQEANP
jgi:hypothetical protein